MRLSVSARMSGASSVSWSKVERTPRMIGTLSSDVSRRFGSAAEPPESATKDTPVTPCDWSWARVSGFTGVAAATSIRTRTLLGSSS